MAALRLHEQALTFLKHCVLSPGQTGAVAPSSRALAAMLAETARVAEASVVVEFGPGTGVVTEAIREKLCEGATLLAIEINAEFIEPLRNRCPDVQVIHDSASNTRRHLDALGLEACDSIVSGLPWTVFEGSLQDAILDAVLECLRPGGLFVTFAYLHSPLLPGGRSFRDKLYRHFAHVEKTPIVWRNFPPAFAYRAQR